MNNKQRVVEMARLKAILDAMSLGCGRELFSNGHGITPEYLTVVQTLRNRISAIRRHLACSKPIANNRFLIRHFRLINMRVKRQFNFSACVRVDVQSDRIIVCIKMTRKENLYGLPYNWKPTFWYLPGGEPCGLILSVGKTVFENGFGYVKLVRNCGSSGDNETTSKAAFCKDGSVFKVRGIEHAKTVMQERYVGAFLNAVGV